jgi:hypothetical protein
VLHRLGLHSDEIREGTRLALDRQLSDTVLLGILEQLAASHAEVFDEDAELARQSRELAERLAGKGIRSSELGNSQSGNAAYMLALAAEHRRRNREEAERILRDE